MPAPIVVEHKKYQYGISCYYMLLASFNFVKYVKTATRRWLQEI